MGVQSTWMDASEPIMLAAYQVTVTWDTHPDLHVILSDTYPQDGFLTLSHPLRSVAPVDLVSGHDTICTYVYVPYLASITSRNGDSEAKKKKKAVSGNKQALIRFTMIVTVLDCTSYFHQVSRAPGPQSSWELKRAVICSWVSLNVLCTYKVIYRIRIYSITALKVCTVQYISRKHLRSPSWYLPQITIKAYENVHPVAGWVG